MKNYNVCIFDKDIHYAKAFMKVVAVEHADFSVVTRSSCGECGAKDIDVCVGFGERDAARGLCEKSFEPACGKYAGVAAILNEARKFAFDSGTPLTNNANRYGITEKNEDKWRLASGSLVCVYAFAGGVGTSCSAIGIGRELARYRGEQILYLSLEDAEDPGLFPAGLSAMRAEETLYRYLRLLNTGAGREGFEKLFRAAAARDEYGLYRLAPDERAGSLANLEPGELYSFLSHAFTSLGLTRLVLDFGTRLNFLKMFAPLSEREEAFYIEVKSAGESYARTRQALFSDEQALTAAFPLCVEDIRQNAGHTDIGLANAFGLAVKDICDSITGDAP